MSQRQHSNPPVPPPPIALMECPVAGLQYHGAEAHWSRIRIEDRLTLQREPGNRHDSRAILVQWQGKTLGYVPREANYALSQIMDGGTRAEARVKTLRPGAAPWDRMMVEVVVHAAPPADPPREPARVVLWPAQNLVPPGVRLATLVGKVTPAQREVGLLTLRELAREITASLSRAAVGIVHADRREVHLWGTLAIEIGVDGTGVVARYLDDSRPKAPRLTADLKEPVCKSWWHACAYGPFDAACKRHRCGSANADSSWIHWILESLHLTFRDVFDGEPLRKAVLEFLAPDPLARSLANRIFGAPPAAESFNWVCDRASVLTLCAVEQPAMLPFLRIVQEDNAMAEAPDPLAALHERLLAEGLEPAAWKKLARWSFAAFEAIGKTWWKPGAIACFANLLHRLDAQAPPPPNFMRYALQAALHRTGPQAPLELERYPDWFMRALLRHASNASNGAPTRALPSDLIDLCLDWLLDARPEPDANQQRAGWPWIAAQAHAYRDALALAAPWSVPVAGMMWGPYQVTAVESAAALAAEAAAMHNCLEMYEDACRAGDVVVYSIRQRTTGARVACFAAQRETRGPWWLLLEVKGRMNTEVGAELERIAHAMVVKLNGGRGGAVPPF